jgi:hypothetical protein
MTDRRTRARTGAWWHRELRGEYVAPVRLPRRDPPPTEAFGAPTERP